MNFSFDDGEQKTALLSSFLLFSIVAAFIILKAARDALFLSDYSARALPYFMGITTLLTAAMAGTYIRLYKTFSLSTAVEMSLKVFAVGTLILWAALKSGRGFATPVLFVWVGVYGAIAPVQAWTVISQQLLVRQAKKALGIIGAGAIIGASAGGFFATWVVGFSSVSALLPTATLLIIAALFTVQALSALSWGMQSNERLVEKPRVQRRFIALVLLVVGSSTFVTTFADFQFKVVAQRELVTAESLARFFGSFYAYIGIATLAFQLFLTPVLMNRLGVAAALSLLPVALTIGNGLFLLTGSLASATLLKGSEQFFKHSVDRSSLEVIYMAIPEDAKIRLKSLIDTVGVRTSEAIAIVVLIFLFSIGKLSLSTLAVVSLTFLAISLVSTFLLGREYPKALTSAIQHKEVNFSGVKTNFFTTDFYHLLPELLKSSSKETILDLLQLLKSTANNRQSSLLRPLLDHPDADVRFQTLQMLFTQEGDLSEKVETMVSDPDRRVRVEAIHYLCSRSSIDPVEKLAHLMTDPEPTVQAAACACSLNLEIEPAQEMAYKRLEELMSDSLNAPRLEVRLEVAHILEYVRPSVSANELYKRLMTDPAPEVRKATLHGIAVMRPTGILQALVEIMGDRPARAEIRRAFASYGALAIPVLRQILSNPMEPLVKKKLSLKILADIGTPDAIEILLEHALGSDLVLRFIAIKTLNRLNKRYSVPLSRPAVESILERELVALEVEMERLRYFLPNPGKLIEAVLNQRRLWARERIFRVLALLYDQKGIYNAYRAFSSNDRRRADSALEYVDAVLLPSHRKRVLRLLEKKTKNAGKYDPNVRKALLFGFLGARDELPAAALIADLNYRELKQWEGEIRGALKVFQNLSLVEETLNWRCASMELSENLQQKLTTIQRLESLGKIDIFSQLGPNELLLLANQSSEEEYQAGEIVFKEGDPANDILALVSGSVELVRGGGPGTLIQPGESFGTISVLGDQPRFFTARAMERSLCLKLERDVFWEILEDYPSICQGIFRVFAIRFGSFVSPAIRT